MANSHRATLRRPPLWTCRCGATYAAWEENGCPVCVSSQGLGSVAREQREARRQETVDRLEERRPVPYNEFPPGY